MSNSFTRFEWRALLLASFAWTLACGLNADPAHPATQVKQTSEELAFHKARLEHWLSVVSLSKDWELEKLRWGSDPSPIATEGHEALRLELRFLADGMDQETEDKQFQEHLKIYETQFGESVLERIFYELMHECHVGPSEAVVTLRVFERDYVVFFNPATGEVLIQLKRDKSYSKEVPLELPSAGRASQLERSLQTPNPDRRAISQSIETFLRNYFTTANRQTHLARPKFDPDDVDNRDHDHVGFVVSGIKSQVLKSYNYWEQIEISLDLVQAPSGLKLLSHIDAYYAGGIGSKLPDQEAYEDMRKSYQNQLKIFADGFLSQLQKQIETGH